MVFGDALMQCPLRMMATAYVDLTSNLTGAVRTSRPEGCVKSVGDHALQGCIGARSARGDLHCLWQSDQCHDGLWRGSVSATAAMHKLNQCNRMSIPSACHKCAASNADVCVYSKEHPASNADELALFYCMCCQHCWCTYLSCRSASLSHCLPQTVLRMAYI